MQSNIFYMNKKTKLQKPSILHRSYYFFNLLWSKIFLFVHYTLEKIGKIWHIFSFDFIWFEKLLTFLKKDSKPKITQTILSILFTIILSNLLGLQFFYKKIFRRILSLFFKYFKTYLWFLKPHQILLYLANKNLLLNRNKDGVDIILVRNLKNEILEIDFAETKDMATKFLCSILQFWREQGTINNKLIFENKLQKYLKDKLKDTDYLIKFKDIFNDLLRILSNKSLNKKNLSDIQQLRLLSAVELIIYKVFNYQFLSQLESSFIYFVWYNSLIYKLRVLFKNINEQWNKKMNNSKKFLNNRNFFFMFLSFVNILFIFLFLSMFIPPNLPSFDLSLHNVNTFNLEQEILLNFVLNDPFSKKWIELQNISNKQIFEQIKNRSSSDQNALFLLEGMFNISTKYNSSNLFSQILNFKNLQDSMEWLEQLETISKNNDSNINLHNIIDLFRPYRELIYLCLKTNIYCFSSSDYQTILFNLYRSSFLKNNNSNLKIHNNNDFVKTIENIINDYFFRNQQTLFYNKTNKFSNKDFNLYIKKIIKFAPDKEEGLSKALMHIFSNNFNSFEHLFNNGVKKIILNNPVYSYSFIPGWYQSSNLRWGVYHLLENKILFFFFWLLLILLLKETFWKIWIEDIWSKIKAPLLFYKKERLRKKILKKYRNFDVIQLSLCSLFLLLLISFFVTNKSHMIFKQHLWTEYIWLTRMNHRQFKKDYIRVFIEICNQSFYGIESIKPIISNIYSFYIIKTIIYNLTGLLVIDLLVNLINLLF